MWMSVGMAAFGISFGVAFGVSLENMAYIGIWIPSGMAMELVLELQWTKKLLIKETSSTWNLNNK